MEKGGTYFIYVQKGDNVYKILSIYKKEKANREKTMKKEKMVRRIEYGVTGVVLCALVAWCGVSVYQKAAEAKASEVTVYEVNTQAMDDYAQSVQAE